MEKPVKYGVIGCGHHAMGAHVLPVEKGVPALALAALCDLSPESMAKAEAAVGRQLKKYTETELLADPEIEAVLIATPDQYHGTGLHRAVNAGKHVFIEKPLAMNETDVRFMKASFFLAKEKGLVISSCHPRRFDPAYVGIKNNIPRWEGKFGKVIGFQLDFSYHRPGESWKDTRGLLVDHMCHEIDLMHFYFGRRQFTAHRLIDEPLRYAASGIRDDGIFFLFQGSRLLDGRVYPEYVTIRFECASVVVCLSTASCVVSSHGVRSSYQETPLWRENKEYGDKFVPMMENFADAIRGRAPNYLSIDDLHVNNTIPCLLQKEQTVRYDC